MSTPRQLVSALRLGTVLALLGLTVLLLGPFQGLVHVFQVSEREAHALAFFGVTLALFATLPRWRRTDLALVALSFATLTEIGQSLTGRSMSLTDLAWDGIGILAALLPGMVERLRHYVRTNPDVNFASLRASDQRRPKASGTEAGPITPAAT